MTEHISAICTALASTVRPVAMLISEPRKLYGRVNKIRTYKDEVIQGFRESKKLHDFFSMLYPNHDGETDLFVIERDGVPDFVIYEAREMEPGYVLSLYGAMRQTLINSGLLWECISAHFHHGDVIAEEISQSLNRASDTEWTDALLLAFSAGKDADLEQSMLESQFEVDKFQDIGEEARVTGWIQPGEGKPNLLRAFRDRKKYEVTIQELETNDETAALATLGFVKSIGVLVCGNEFVILELLEGGEHRCINVSWKQDGFVISSNLINNLQLIHDVAPHTSRVALSAMKKCEGMSLDLFDTRILVETAVKLASSNQFLSLRGRVYNEVTVEKEALGVDHESKNIFNFPKLAQLVRNMELILEEATNQKRSPIGRVTATFADLRDLQMGKRKEDIGLASDCERQLFRTLADRIRGAGPNVTDPSSGKGISILANTGWEGGKRVISQVLKKIGDRAAGLFKKSRKPDSEMREIKACSNPGLLWFDRIFAGGTLTQKRRDELKKTVLRKDEPTCWKGRQEEVYYFPLIDTIFAITDIEEVRHYRAGTVQLASYGGRESHPGVLAAFVKWLDYDKSEENN